ncbi:MAG: hypothetical protein ACRD3Q_03665 [Terriglobales bacterium]
MRPEHWERDTPCREWTVRQLLNHRWERWTL